MRHPIRHAITALATVALLFSYADTPSLANDPPERPAGRGEKFLKLKLEARLFSQIVPLSPDDAVGVGTVGSRQCVTTGEPGSIATVDKDISCDDPLAPDNEVAIAVHPTRPELLLGGSNDYQLNFVGATLVLRVPAGFFLSQDGGATWTDGQVPMKASLGAGDPAPAFNLKYNRAHMASLSFVCGQGSPLCSRGNLAIANLDLDKLTGEPDQAIPWQDKMIVNGSASDIGAVQIFSDKEWIAVDNNPRSPHYGNVYLTYSRFRSEHGAYDESPIWFTKSEDGGQSWSEPVEISGRNPVYCTFQDDADDAIDPTGDNNPSGVSETPDDPFACDQDQFSYPAVAPNGDLYVHFHNEQNSAAYEAPQKYDSQIMIVKSTDGGDTFFGEPATTANQAGCVRQAGAASGPGGSCIVPRHVVNLEDSYDTTEHPTNPAQNAVPDYPVNVQGRSTLTGHQFRVNSAGTIAIAPNPTDPTGVSYRVYVVFADNFAGVRPGSGTGTPVTNTNVYYAYSDDGGATWAGGDTGGASGTGRLTVHPTDTGIDQWFPWAAANPNTGALHVGYMDGSRDSATRRLYDFSLASSGPLVLDSAPGFAAPAFMSGAPSDPNNSVFFRAGATDCMNCSTFIGDYNGLAVGSDGAVHGVWTDHRRGFPAAGGPKASDAYYAQLPITP